MLEALIRRPTTFAQALAQAACEVVLVVVFLVVVTAVLGNRHPSWATLLLYGLGWVAVAALRWALIDRRRVQRA